MFYKPMHVFSWATQDGQERGGNHTSFIAESLGEELGEREELMWHPFQRRRVREGHGIFVVCNTHLPAQ